MVFTVVALGVFAAAVWLVRQAGPVPEPYGLLPEDDQPPFGAHLPVPRGGSRFDRYVGRGLLELDDYLADACRESTEATEVTEEEGPGFPG